MATTADSLPLPYQLVLSGGLLATPRGEKRPARGVPMQIPALIRTYVPVGVGYALSFLATLGVTVDGNSRNALILGLGAVLSAAYYTVVHALESRWPAFSVLLGSSAQPSYDSPLTPSGSGPATVTPDSPEDRR